MYNPIIFKLPVQVSESNIFENKSNLIINVPKSTYTNMQYWIRFRNNLL